MAKQLCGQVCQRTPEDWSEWVEWLEAGLHSENRWRLPLVLSGLLFAKGRRTVTSWLRAAGLRVDYSDYYYFISSVGRNSSRIATLLLQLLLRLLPLPERLTLAIDDTPTKRYGPRVEGAGLHRNPTSGPDDHKFIPHAARSETFPLKAHRFVHESPKHVLGWRNLTRIESSVWGE